MRQKRNAGTAGTRSPRSLLPAHPITPRLTSPHLAAPHLTSLRLTSPHLTTLHAECNCRLLHDGADRIDVDTDYGGILVDANEEPTGSGVER